MTNPEKSNPNIEALSESGGQISVSPQNGDTVTVSSSIDG
jgi:hypothetical protein